MCSPTQSSTLTHVRRALALTGFDAPTAWARMTWRRRINQTPPNQRGKTRLAGVLVLLYPHLDDLYFVLTRRTDKVKSHKGQISLPGGAQDDGETLTQTAIRETCEELGLCEIDGRLEILGSLTPLYLSVSRFEIQPIVGYLPERPAFNPAPEEVEAVLEMSLSMLLDDSLKHRKWHKPRNYPIPLRIPYYDLHGEVLWGATAIVLSEFEWRLRGIME